MSQSHHARSSHISKGAQYFGVGERYVHYDVPDATCDQVPQELQFLTDGSAVLAASATFYA